MITRISYPHVTRIEGYVHCKNRRICPTAKLIDVLSNLFCRCYKEEFIFLNGNFNALYQFSEDDEAFNRSHLFHQFVPFQGFFYFVFSWNLAKPSIMNLLFITWPLTLGCRFERSSWFFKVKVRNFSDCFPRDLPRDFPRANVWASSL